MASNETPAGASVTTGTTTESLVTQFSASLPEILESTEYDEMWGVTLKNADDVPTSIVLTKYLRANTGNLDAAKKQLTSALEWRKKMKPLELVKQSFSEERFGGLGYVTTHKGEAKKETIISWNIYGAVKDNKKTFGDVEEFIKWRAALMEFSVHKLDLPSATERIPDDGVDQYQMIQVHDYLSVSFFRPDPNVKKASQEAIRVFSLAYPELLSHKYFVNVPALMGWMYGLMKLFVAPATLKKFHPMSSGTTLGTELPGIAATLPEAYGGKGPDVKTAGETVGLGKEPTPTAEATTDATKTEAAAAVPFTTSDVNKESVATAGPTSGEATTAVAEETKPSEVQTGEVKPVEVAKQNDFPNPLGSAPVQPIAEATPVQDVKTDETVQAVPATMVVPETKVEEAAAVPVIAEEGKPEVKA